MGRREYKLYFLSIFPPKTKYHEKKLKYFLSSYFSIISLFSILSFFHSSNQTDPFIGSMLMKVLRKIVNKPYWEIFNSTFIENIKSY